MRSLFLVSFNLSSINHYFETIDGIEIDLVGPFVNSNIHVSLKSANYCFGFLLLLKCSSSSQDTLDSMQTDDSSSSLFAFLIRSGEIPNLVAFCSKLQIKMCLFSWAGLTSDFVRYTFLSFSVKFSVYPEHKR